MESGAYEARSLDHPERTAVVELDGRPAGRMVREAIVAFIAAFWAEHGYAPAVREIGAAVGPLGVSPTHRHLVLLAEAGRIAFSPSKQRSIRVVEASQ